MSIETVKQKFASPTGHHKWPHLHKVLGVSHMTVVRAWKAGKLKRVVITPHNIIVTNEDLFAYLDSLNK